MAYLAKTDPFMFDLSFRSPVLSVRSSLLTFLLCSCTSLFSQCLTGTLAAGKDPEQTLQIQKGPLAVGSLPRGILTIPVVVHVVWHQPTENVPDETIYDQIASLNADFRFRHADTADIPQEFRALATDCEIEFCLSAVEPGGNPASGILRTYTPHPFVGSVDPELQRIRIFADSLGGSDAWDPGRYLNIWVGKIQAPGLGYASFPWDTTFTGVVIDPAFFGRTCNPSLEPKHDRGRTLTHEIGHFLGLLHPWGQQYGCDTLDGDEVGDTPLTQQPFYGCPDHPQSSCGQAAMFMNFMDYVDDPCFRFFTQGQKQRMLSYLASASRSGLLSGADCRTLPLIPEPVQEVSLYPNPFRERAFLYPHCAVQDELQVEVFDLSGKQVATFRFAPSDQFELKLHGLPAGTYALHVHNSRLDRWLRAVRL